MLYVRGVNIYCDDSSVTIMKFDQDSQKLGHGNYAHCIDFIT